MTTGHARRRSVAARRRRPGGGLCGLLLLLLLVPSSVAGSGSAGAGDPFTEGVGARERALGSGVAQARGPAALGWNPALLTTTDRLAMHAHLSPLPAGGSYEHVGVALPWGPGVAGVGFTRLGADDITTYDAASVATGSLSFTDGEIGIGYGLPLPGGLHAGMLWRQRWQSLGDDRAGGSGLDLGIAATPGRWPGLRMGARLRGVLTPALTLGYRTDRLPRTLDLGLAYDRRFAGRALSCNAGSTFGAGGRSLVLGTEIVLAEQLTARLGLAGTRPRCGVGLLVGSFDLDYLVESRDLGLLHGVSITAHLGSGAAVRLQTIEASARAAGAAMERATQERQIDDFRQAARRRAAAGEVAAARRLWLAYQLHRPDDPEAAAALTRLAQQESVTRRDSLLVIGEQQRLAEQLAAIRAALDSGGLDAAATLLEQLPAGSTVTPARRELSARLTQLTTARVARLRHEARALDGSGRLAAATAVWSRLLLLTPADAEAAAGIERAQTRLATLEQQRDARVDDVARLSLLVRAFQAYSTEEFVLSEMLVDSLLVIEPTVPAGLELKRRLVRRTSPPAAHVTEDARTLYIEGMRYFNNGRYADAIAAWERILLLDPDNDSVRRNIDAARARLGIERREE